MHAVAAASYPLSRLPARTSPPIICTPPFRLRQGANSLSAPNKLLIRCAWAGTAAFASAGYGSSWAPGSFTTKVSLKTAVTEFNSNAASAIAKYGPIADWCVSAITEMTTLFYNLKNFNADIFGWDTSSVTTMHYMFWVRAPRVPLAPKP